MAKKIAPYPYRPSAEPWVGIAHQHRWTRTGFGTGTSESTMLWGPWHCWCGVTNA